MQNCKDCHTMQTEYPWYAQLPIAKQLMEADINKGFKPVLQAYLVKRSKMAI